MSRLHRVESYGHGINGDFVVCSFETEQYGYYQAKYYGSTGLRSLDNEPNINYLHASEREEIETILQIVYYYVFEHERQYYHKT